MPFSDRMSAEKIEFARMMRENPTESEAYLYRYLCGRHLVRIRRQVPILGYIADFYSEGANLVIEVDGSSHWGRSEYDATRDRAMVSHGIRVLRVTNEQLAENPVETLTIIGDALEGSIEHLVRVPGVPIPKFIGPPGINIPSMKPPKNIERWMRGGKWIRKRDRV